MIMHRSIWSDNDQRSRRTMLEEHARGTSQC